MTNYTICLILQNSKDGLTICICICICIFLLFVLCITLYFSSEHCLIEYDGEAVVLHPKNELVSVDGIPLAEPTRLPQGIVLVELTLLQISLFKPY